jgi:hypothetical protein
MCRSVSLVTAASQLNTTSQLCVEEGQHESNVMVQDHSTPAKVGYEADESVCGEAELGGRAEEACDALETDQESAGCSAGEGHFAACFLL